MPENELNYFYNNFVKYLRKSPDFMSLSIPTWSFDSFKPGLKYNTNTFPGLSNLGSKPSFTTTSSTSSLTLNPLLQKGISTISTGVTNALSNKIFGNSDIGRIVGGIFGSASSTALDTLSSNLLSGTSLSEGLTKNVGGAVGGQIGGLLANYAGQGIQAAMGNSKLGKFAGGATSSAGGLMLGSLLGSGKVSFGNPITFGTSVLGSALGNMNGPSKEYEGKYGGITKGLDAGYDAVMLGINFVPVWGQAASGFMALNKGLSNVFGSTDGVTKADAILGSAFSPFFLKWLNAGFGKKSHTFENLSERNKERTNTFMGNAFGDLSDKFDKAREYSNKKFGMFSYKRREKENENIDWSNNAFRDIMAMTDLNELLNIRSQLMTSINNLRYALSIQGGYNPILIGKQGMRILNNQTNHNIGQRLLSAAALIDNKQMILSAKGGTKILKAQEGTKIDVALNINHILDKSK